MGQINVFSTFVNWKSLPSIAKRRGLSFLTAQIHKYGKSHLNSFCRGPLYGLDKHMIGLIEARVQAERAAYESEVRMGEDSETKRKVNGGNGNW